MSFIIPEAIEAYALAHTAAGEPLFAELADETRRKTPLPQMLTGPVEGMLLHLLVKISGARRVLELGTFTGYSALRMAQALPEEGRLITCDLCAEYVAIAKKYFSRSPHGEKIEVRLGPALTTIRAFEAESFDFMFIDADKKSYPLYYEEGLRLLRPGGLMAVDNTLWSGRVLEPADEDARAIDLFNKKATSDPRSENVLLTVRDGIMLVRKRPS